MKRKRIIALVLGVLSVLVILVYALLTLGQIGLDDQYVRLGITSPYVPWYVDRYGKWPHDLSAFTLCAAEEGGPMERIDSIRERRNADLVVISADGSQFRAVLHTYGILGKAYRIRILSTDLSAKGKAIIRKRYSTKGYLNARRESG